MRSIFLAPLFLLLVACATPITTKNVGPDRVYQRLSTNALLHRKPSMPTKVALHRASLVDEWDDDPRTALTALHHAALEIDGRDRLFALAELSYLTARRERDPSLYVASAVYAYLFLVGQDPQPRVHIMDRRARAACELYNRSLTEAFRSEDGERFEPVTGVVQLPVGSINIVAADQLVRLGDQTFTEFHPAADYEVRGMTARIVTSGIGSALIAGPPPSAGISDRDLGARSRIAASAFLDIEGELPDAESGTLRGTLTLHATVDEPTIVVRGATVPLETDITAPVAPPSRPRRDSCHLLDGE
jgi:hypothetical protein